MLKLIRNKIAETSRESVLWTLRKAAWAGVHQGRARIVFLQEGLDMPVCAFLLGGEYARDRRWKKPRDRNESERFEAIWFEELEKFDRQEA